MPDTNETTYSAGSDPIVRDAEITTTTTTTHSAAADTDDTAAEATPEITETRAQIEETRAQMADTVDAIREKLSPAHMVEEAKDAAKTAAKDAAHGVVDKAKELAGSAMDAVSSAAGAAVAKASDAVDSVKDALHLGSGSEGDAAASPDYVAPYYTATPGATSGGTLSPPSRSASETYNSEPGYPRRAFDSASAAVSPYVTTGLTTGAKIVDTIKLNPLPAALIGIGLGWLLMSARRQSSTTLASSGGYATRPSSGLETYTDEAYGAYQTPTATDYNTGYTTSNTGYTAPSTGYVSGVSSVGEVEPSRTAQAKEVLGNAKDAVGDFASGAKDKVADVASGAKEAVAGVAGTAKDKASDLAAHASDLAAQAKYKASDLTEQAKSRAADLASGVKDRASDVVGTVGLKANQFGTAAKSQSQYAASSVDSFVHENPLAAGAIALVVGAAVGLALPSTSKENELIGPHRDRLADQAGAKASEMVDKVQHVAEAALGVAKDNLGQAKDDLTSSLSDTLAHTKEALGSAKEAVTDAVKSEAQNQGLAQKSDSGTGTGA